MQERIQLLLDIVGIVILQDVVIILNAVNQLADVLFNVGLVAESWGGSVLVHVVFVELLTGHDLFRLS